MSVTPRGGKKKNKAITGKRWLFFLSVDLLIQICSMNRWSLKEFFFLSDSFKQVCTTLAEKLCFHAIRDVTDVHFIKRIPILHMDLLNKRFPQKKCLLIFMCKLCPASIHSAGVGKPMWAMLTMNLKYILWWPCCHISKYRFVSMQSNMQPGADSKELTPSGAAVRRGETSKRQFDDFKSVMR